MILAWASPFKPDQFQVTSPSFRLPPGGTLKLGSAYQGVRWNYSFKVPLGIFKLKKSAFTTHQIILLLAF